MNTYNERNNVLYTVIALMKLERANAELRMEEWKLEVGKGQKSLLLILSMRYTNKEGKADSAYRMKNFPLPSHIQHGVVYPYLYDWLEQATEELKQVRGQ